jgi:dephospho-CoA kinase
LNRAALGTIVFDDADARRHLESIVHPLVYARIESWFESQSGALALADIPLLFETAREGAFDVVIVTWCAPQVQIERLQQRDGLTAHAAKQRLAAQWPLDEKVRLADYAIRTDGTFAETNAQVGVVYEQLRARAIRA